MAHIALLTQLDIPQSVLTAPTRVENVFIAGVPHCIGVVSNATPLDTVPIASS
jgi:hypothetical protein